MNIALLASGGVDSSVAMLKLSEQYSKEELKVYYLKIWLDDELDNLGVCPWKEDIDYVQRTCDLFGLQLHIVSLQREYYERIVSYVIQELHAGRTPSPDVLCNRRIKFGTFLNKLQESPDYVASGHYALGTGSTVADYRLHCSPDPVKDQTYFLSQMTTEQLLRTTFPIGRMTKEEVRAVAEHNSLPSSRRQDSQGICFLGKIPYRDFVEHYLGSRPGKIVDEQTGTILGEHRGYWFHTIGQRQGLGLGNGPWFVSAKDIESNVIFVSHQSAIQPHRSFRVGFLNWIGNAAREGACRVKIRHAPESHAAHISIQGDTVYVEMEHADQGIAAGQYAVFYHDTVCLGGGKILAE